MSIATNQLRIARELWTRLQPLDRAVPSRLHALLADRRFGSRDRRLYRELLLTALRQARALAKLPPDDTADWAAHLAATCAATRETEPFRTEFTPTASDSVIRHSSLDIRHSEAALALLPPWFPSEHDPALPPEHSAASVATALLARAPVWVRLQTDSPEDAFAEWAARGWTATPHPALPDAVKLPPETAVSGCTTYQAGNYEIQDLGSQLVLAALDLPAASPGPRWLDVCAGAGGKTLHLARLLGPTARIDASDIRPAPLVELRARAARAGLASRIRTIPHPDGSATYDGVLVDAPCSGSGTWRRSPHLMACTSESDLAAAARTQLALLTASAARVRPGGLIVYATCSIARTENSAVAAAFLAAHAVSFAACPPALDFGFPRIAPAGIAFTPGAQDNDGLYVAAFRRLA
jgi:16S rRNA (cytosine967-C5)-methyltransferase